MGLNTFVEISIILVIATIIAIILQKLKQPIIISYIITGILVSPYFLNIVKSTDAIATFSHIGVALLLFLVGLNLNPKIIREVGKVSLITGVGQVIFTSTIGYIIGILLGFSKIESLYIAVALTFSSTIIIMKLLSDKGDLEKLYGRISVGFLIVQDLIVVLILLLVSSNTDSKGINFFLEVIAKIIFLTLFLYVSSKYLLPKITRITAKSQETLLLFSLSWAFIIATIAYYFKFSIEAGALLAGIALSNTKYVHEIESRLKPLRDFFIILFFIYLGTQMIFITTTQYFVPIIIFSLFILLGNPLIVMILMGLLGYTKRNSFLAGLTVAQISEFSLILISLGVTLGHLNKEILSLVTIIGLITITLSSYMIIYSEKIYKHISKYLNIFERKGKKVDEHEYYDKKNYEIIIFGYDRDYDVLEHIKSIKKKMLIVDYDPEKILELSKKGFEVIYGDIKDIEFLEKIDLKKAKMIISTIKDNNTNLLLLKKVREKNKKAIIILTAHNVEEAIELYDKGATYILMPQYLSGKHISTLIEKHKFNINKFLKEKIEHINHLKKKHNKK